MTNEVMRAFTPSVSAPLSHGYRSRIGISAAAIGNCVTHKTLRTIGNAGEGRAWVERHRTLTQLAGPPPSNWAMVPWTYCAMEAITGGNASILGPLVITVIRYVSLPM